MINAPVSSSDTMHGSYAPMKAKTSSMVPEVWLDAATGMLIPVFTEESASEQERNELMKVKL